MSSEFGNDFITISDEEGNDFVLEHVHTLEIEDVVYMAFLPTDLDEDDDDYGLIILKVIEENGEEILASIDDEVLLEEIYGHFVKYLFDDDEV